MAVTMRNLDAAAAKAQTDLAKDDRTGIANIAEGTAAGQTLKTKLSQLQEQLGYLLSLLNSGQVVARATTGLDVTVKGLVYRLAGTEYTLPDDDSFACQDNATNYLFVDTDQVVEKSITGWPAGAHYKLALVVCAAGAITSVVNAQPRNHNPGSLDDWSTQAATQNVNLADNALLNTLGIDFTPHANLTIAAGVVTPGASPKFLYTITSESGTSDDLTNITAVAGERRLILIQPVSGHSITVKDTGNINLIESTNAALTLEWHALLLLQTSDTEWTEVARNRGGALTSLQNSLNALVNRIHNIGTFNFFEETKTIAVGSITQGSSSIIIVANEAAAATDDLDTIVPASGVVNGDLLVLRGNLLAASTDVIHGVAENKIKLGNNKNFNAMSVWDSLLLRYGPNGSGVSQWIEVARSRLDSEALANTGFGNPFPIQFFVSGAVAVGVHPQRIEAPVALKLVRGRGRVVTAPTGAAMIVDIRVNATSIYASQAAMINIPDAGFADVSDTKSPPVAVSQGDIIDIEVEQVGSGVAGSNLAVVLEAYTEIAVPPT